MKKHQSLVGVGIVLMLAMALSAGCGADHDPDALDTSATVTTALSAIPTDILAAGLQVAPLTPEGTIPEAQALDIAARDHGPNYAGGIVDAYLVSLTDPATLRGGSPIRDTAVWLIRYSGLSIPVSGPITAGGSPADGGTISFAYVVLDAATGEWLYTTETG